MSKFKLFTESEKASIIKDYNEIIQSDKSYRSFTMEKIQNATKGMYIKSAKTKTKEYLFNIIKESQKNKTYPIIHDDSLTYWGNLAVEKYGLEIKDIVKMKPGEKIRVILFDRNIGDYMHGTKVGTKYDPTKKDLIVATYIHGKDLTGILIFEEMNIVHSPFTWEINGAPYKKPFWCPLTCDYDMSKLNKKTKIGWRGPCIRFDDAKKLPKKVKHYGTWWDDYMVWKYTDFLNKK